MPGHERLGLEVVGGAVGSEDAANHNVDYQKPLKTKDAETTKKLRDGKIPRGAVPQEAGVTPLEM